MTATPYSRPTAANVTPGAAGQIYFQIITPTPTPPAVSTLVLVNAANGAVLAPLSNATAPTPFVLPPNVTPVVQANATMIGNGGVRFSVTATQPSTNFDSVIPYQSLPLSSGRSAIVVQPFYQPAVGTPGPTRVVRVNIATLTPSPTVSAPICPAGFSAGEAQPLSDCPPTPCPTLEPTPTNDPLFDCLFFAQQTLIATLGGYGVVVENVSNWTPDELNALCQGVVKTGKALQAQYGGGSPQDTFRRVMIGAGRSQIAFNRVLTGGPFCETDNNVAPPLQSKVTCFGLQPGQTNALQFVQYTAVHELGHVFVGRTGGFQAGSTYFGLIDVPPFATVVATGTIVADPVLRDNLRQPVMGAFIDANNNPDWVRGGRGWGSPASTPPAVPCNFQQNAFTVNDATASQADKERERDEASADMFLNWVYSKIGENGFTDNDWRNISNCAATPPPTPTGTPPAPGAARYNYMETVVLPTLATLFPTMTSTP